jgi:hypothetical protein
MRVERPPLGGDHTEPLAWFDQQLTSLGIRRTAPPTLVKERPWANVFSSETDRGLVWLKVSGAGTRFEVGLYALMHRIAPEHVLEPLALDVDRAWIVLPDGGRILADQTDAERLPGQLADVFAQYAELQIAVAAHVEDLLSVGVADMRAEMLPERFEQALEFVAAYIARRGTPEERATYEQLTGLRTQVAQWCERLAAAPGAASLDHNDLHPWNVFWVEGRPAKFYDWGDAVVAHPFASMLVGLGVLKRLHHLPDRDHRLLQVRDAYLEPFGALGSRAELVETCELACRVAEIARCLVWARAAGEMGAAAPDSYQTAPMEHLSHLLDASYLGRSSADISFT